MDGFVCESIDSRRRETHLSLMLSVTCALAAMRTPLLIRQHTSCDWGVFQLSHLLI